MKSGPSRICSYGYIIPAPAVDCKPSRGKTAGNYAVSGPSFSLRVSAAAAQTTSAAPPSFSVRMHSVSVAPVVQISSMSRMRRPRTRAPGARS